MKSQVGACFGLTVAQLDDGRITADWIAEKGPAFRAGIKKGYEIIEWKRILVKQA